MDEQVLEAEAKLREMQSARPGFWQRVTTGRDEPWLGQPRKSRWRRFKDWAQDTFLTWYFVGFVVCLAAGGWLYHTFKEAWRDCKRA